jgi:hypothetical protein
MLLDGLTDGLMELDGETEALGLTLGLTLPLGETDADGETLGLVLLLGLTDALGDWLADGEIEADADNPGTSNTPTQLVRFGWRGAAGIAAGNTLCHDITGTSTIVQNGA